MIDEPDQSPEELGALLKRLYEAAAEQSLNGAMRRQLVHHTRSLTKLAHKIDCDIDLFCDWQEGLAELPGGVMTRLAEELGLVLVESSK